MEYLIMLLISFGVAVIYYFNDKRAKETIGKHSIPMFSSIQLRRNVFFRTFFLFAGIVCVYWIFKILEWMYLSMLSQ